MTCNFGKKCLIATLTPKYFWGPMTKSNLDQEKWSISWDMRDDRHIFKKKRSVEKMISIKSSIRT